MSGIEPCLCGDPACPRCFVQYDAADATWTTGPITVARRRHVYDLAIRVELSADVADALPGFPGCSGVHADGEHWCEPPESGLDLVLGRALEQAQRTVEASLSAADFGHADAFDAVVSAPDGGVRFVETVVLDSFGAEVF